MSDNAENENEAIISEIMSKEMEIKITKSGLNHRFIKIKEIADKLRNKGN